MNILVCIRQGLDGEINPFDASAYETALQIPGGNVTLVSMGPAKCQEFLLKLTRLGAKKAVLLCDRLFAGADTLATAYALSLAVKKLNPDLILCGRQTLVGDTAQTGPMLSVFSERHLITNVLNIESTEGKVVCTTREQGVQEVSYPALLTLERIKQLRLPSILSRPGEVEVWDAGTLDADPDRCGLQGSPTRVIQTFENQSGKRKCKFIAPTELSEAIKAGLQRQKDKVIAASNPGTNLPGVAVVGQDPLPFANLVCEDVTVLKLTDADTLAQQIRSGNFAAVLWGSDDKSKQLAAQVAAMLRLGLCADCTHLETDGEKLLMYRPALSGSIIAKIESLSKPAMATVRTTRHSSDIIVSAGWGAKDDLDAIKAFADRLQADLAASRKAVDNGILPYPLQVGLTGKTVGVPVYIAFGISGAVHHIVGMQQSGTVIAVNPDPDAPIFDYADYGILADCKTVLNQQKG